MVSTTQSKTVIEVEEPYRIMAVLKQNKETGKTSFVRIDGEKKTPDGAVENIPVQVDSKEKGPRKARKSSAEREAKKLERAEKKEQRQRSKSERRQKKGKDYEPQETKKPVESLVDTQEESKAAGNVPAEKMHEKIQLTDAEKAERKLEREQKREARKVERDAKREEKALTKLAKGGDKTQFDTPAGVNTIKI